MNSFSFENVISGGAISISLTGMSIVFSGLLLISIYIRFLPSILVFFDRYVFRKTIPTEENANVAEASVAVPDTAERDLASVIGLVMQFEAIHHETPVQKEEKDIAQIIGMVLNLEQERVFGLPN